MSYLQIAADEGSRLSGATGCGCDGCRAAGLGDPSQNAQERLRQMAKWPDRAHGAWKKLDFADRSLVTVQMAANYGTNFAKQFLASVGKRNPQDIVEHYYGPDVGPSPGKLKTNGYVLVQKDSVHEWWVHPTGERVTRNYTTSHKSTPVTQTKPTPPPRQGPCHDVDVLSDAICSNADKICRIAAELNDEPSKATCRRAKASCADARKKSQSCDGGRPGLSGSGTRVDAARDPSLGNVGQFQLLDAATCPPAGFTNAQATGVVRRAIAVAIGIAKRAASKLDSIDQKRTSGLPRSDEDQRVAKLFTFFFRHDPNHPIPWADNKPSGVNVAHRLRKAAEALVTRGLHYRGACPGAPLTRRGQAAPGGVHIRLCNAFWNVPAGLHIDAETFRAGIILHETLHVIYDTINDAGPHRANDHCYEAFAMRAAGHGADRQDVRQCRPDLFP